MSLPLDSAEDMMDPSSNSPAIQSRRGGRDDIRSQTGVDVRVDVQVCVCMFVYSLFVFWRDFSGEGAGG